jgi:hypothetical protein
MGGCSALPFQPSSPSQIQKKLSRTEFFISLKFLRKSLDCLTFLRECAYWTHDSTVGKPYFNQGSEIPIPVYRFPLPRSCF